MKLKITFIATTIICLLTSITFSQSNLEKANHLFDNHRQNQGPGISIRVTQDDQILYKNNAGSANLQHQIPISDSTRFLVGSISKQFTCYSILLLENEGKLSLDDPITKYLPELDELNQTITLRMLANHTNGFRNTIDVNGLRGRSDQDLIGQNEMVSVLLRQRGLNFTPGSTFQYNNAGYVLLAEIVQRASGIPFSDYVDQNIFHPLNMRNSQFLDHPGTLIPNKADSYIKTTDGYEYVPMNRSIVGSTGLYTTTEDLTKWTQHFKQEQSIIFQKMIAPSLLNSGETIPYGLGMETKLYRGVKVVFHGGGDAAFRAYLLYLPKYNFTVAVTGNYESFNPLDIAYGMIDIFLADQLEPQRAMVTPQLTTSDLKKYAGTYQVFPGFYIDILAENDSLFMRSVIEPNGELYLPIITENEFEFTGRQHSKMVFSSGKMVWHFSDFAYPAKRVQLSPPSYNQINSNEHLGSFYSDELQTSYTIVKKDDKLVATHAFNDDIELIPIDTDAFISASSTLGRVEFIRNEEKIITGCLISSQSAHNVHFVKRQY